MELHPAALAVFAVCFLNAPTPGVTEDHQTLSCCEQVKIPIMKGCDHTFVIGLTTVAQVNDTNATVMKPLQFLEDERMMLVLDCVDFTHDFSCDVAPGQATLKIVHNQLISCPKDAAAVLQGSLLSLLLVMALRMMIC